MMENQPNVLKTGTSTIGITFDGGVVVGADHRATMGHFIANKSVQKLFKIGDNLALTTAALSVMHNPYPGRSLQRFHFSSFAVSNL